MCQVAITTDFLPFTSHIVEHSRYFPEEKSQDHHIDSMLSIWYPLAMESTGRPNDPLSRFALSIFWINGLLMRNGDRLTRSIGQSSARWQVLGRVGDQPQTVAQIARNMGHARQSVQRVANVL